MGLNPGVDLFDTISADEPADLLATMDIREFAIGTVPLRVGWMLAFAPLSSADLILRRGAAWMHGAKGQQLFLNY